MLKAASLTGGGGGVFKKVENNNKSHKFETESKYTFINFMVKGK